MNSIYITTPIYYSNDVPHIGHTSTTLFADILSRYYKELGMQVLFTTGNDEHGQKVAQVAQEKNMDPQSYVDEMANQWKTYWDQLNVGYDYFVRTTNPQHEEIVVELLTKLYEKGDVYKKKYTGLYCVGCEEFKTKRGLIDGKCEEHPNKELVKIEEENYFFKITKYLDQVKTLIESDKIHVFPENKRNEMIAKIATVEDDLSISRPSVDWGIRIPWDPEHTIYVWVEALMNYYTSTVILDKTEYWPANYHIVGKGINWFHSVIWPSLLLALDIEVPKSVFAHSHLIVNGQKMGKSLGNVISPKELIDAYGVDGTRYLLAATIPFQQDSDVSMELYKSKYSYALKNGIGNSLSRLTKLAENNNLEFDFNIKFTELMDKYPDVNNFYKSFQFNKVVDFSEELLNQLSQFINEQTPWAKTGEEAEKIIREASYNLLVIVTILQPIIPEAYLRVRDGLTGKIKSVTPLFN